MLFLICFLGMKEYVLQRVGEVGVRLQRQLQGVGEVGVTVLYYWVPQGNLAGDFRVGFPMILGQTWPQDLARSPGPALQINLHENSALQTNFTAITGRTTNPARLPWYPILQRQLQGFDDVGHDPPDVVVARRPDGGSIQLRRNQQHMPCVIIAPHGRVVHIVDCGSVGLQGREVPVCIHCLERHGVRPPDLGAVRRRA